MSDLPSAASIQALRAAGLTYADIGRAVGRDKSLIRQVATGAKPGENMRAALAELRDRLTAAPNPRQAARESAPVQVERRTTAKGSTARVRRPVTVSGRGWQTSTARRQAASSGGRGMAGPLRQAARAGKSVAVTASFSTSVTVARAYGRRGVAGSGGTAEMNLGTAAEVREDMADRGYGPDEFSWYVLELLSERGDIAPDVDAADLTGLEMRAWD